MFHVLKTEYEFNRELYFKMNHIKRLQAENEAYKKRLKEAQGVADELRSYLDLPKFEEDPYVNKQDVFNRLEGLRFLTAGIEI